MDNESAMQGQRVPQTRSHTMVAMVSGSHILQEQKAIQMYQALGW